METVEVLTNPQLDLGEGPLWDVRTQMLYWVELLAGHIYRYDPATSSTTHWTIGLPVGCLALREAGGFVLGTRDGFAFWDEQTTQLEFIGDPEADRPESRFNDGKVDRQGRFWAGTTGRGATSGLYRLDPNWKFEQLESGLTISNGLGWSPDNMIMYLTDSPTQTIFAYDFDAANGTLQRRRVFVHTAPEPGVPDGLTVDSEGYIWSARWGGSKVSRYAPDGSLDREIALPVEYPTSCMFGGANLATLFITSARKPLRPEHQAVNPLAGAVFQIELSVPGLPEHRFAG
jgi:sugar lactone lactonase YvrE